MIFNDDQRLLAETFRAFARERLKPEYLNRPAGRPDQALLDELANLGVLGLLVPEEHGGSGATSRGSIINFPKPEHTTD